MLGVVKQSKRVAHDGLEGWSSRRIRGWSISLTHPANVKWEGWTTTTTGMKGTKKIKREKIKKRYNASSELKRASPSRGGACVEYTHIHTTSEKTKRRTAFFLDFLEIMNRHHFFVSEQAIKVLSLVWEVASLQRQPTVLLVIRQANGRRLNKAHRRQTLAGRVRLGG
jgi:hypothetical protein